MWTNNGTITVVTGSRYVEGQGTQFVGPVIAGYALLTGDLRLYEIEAVESATRLRLVRPYQGGGAANVPYDVVPVSPDVTGLIERIQALIDRYQGFRDTVGQGMFPDGAAAAPGLRFIADQDTGLRRLDANRMSLVAGSIDSLIIGIDGVQAVRPFVSDLALTSAGARALRIESSLNNASDVQLQIVTPNRAWHIGQNVGGTGAGTLNFYDVTGGSCRMLLDQSGNLLVGVTSASNHVIARGVTEGDLIMQVQGKAHPGVAFFSAASGSANGSACAFALNKNSQTGRSINAAGTINGSGADYAEYMLKAAGCGLIAKGDVCGVDRDGRLTKTWADAISFVVKSTDPSLVGGDTWAAHLPPRPEAPGAEPEPPVLPTVPEETADDAEVAAYRAALAAYPALVTQYKADHDAWEAATAAYERDLPAWQDNLEAARICVDRIAFCGQVPCNVTGDFEVGDYIVAVANGAGIKAVAMKLDDMTVAQYARRIGKVWAIRDGRAWIDVQHG